MGNGRPKKPLFPGLESQANAHNEDEDTPDCTTVGADHRIKVQRLFAAVDCGRVVNSGLVEQQIEAGLIWALGQATVPSPEWVAGMPRARPLGGIGLPRIGDTPQISVEVIPSSDAPGGVSGLGTTVLAPAVANAIHSATGKRLRSLPFDLTAAA